MISQLKCRVAAFLLLALAPAAYSQDVRASITGVVADPTGAPVANAKVTVTSAARNVTVSTETNTSGNFVTPFLAPGAYVLTVEASGFKRFVREKIALQAQDRARIDVALELGELAQSVTISEAVSQLQTETASRASVIAREIIANVPTQGRNPFQIAWAAPNVVKTGAWRYLRSFDIAGTSNLSINGGRNRENEVLLDGISNVQSDRTVIAVPTTESVQEFKVQTNTYDAQYGRTGGGVITVVTKGGGNSFHGTAFEYFQAEELNANQTELNRVGTKKPPMNINQFGAQVSGPIFIPKVFNGKNRAFWMVSWESMRQRSADPGAATIPLMDWRTGDFSTLLNAQGQPVLIYDPASTRADGSRTPIPNNRIAASQIDPVAKALLALYPAPLSPGEGPARVLNYIYPSRWIASFDQFVGRTDLVVNSKNNVFFRYGENPFQEFRNITFGLNNPAEPTGNAPLLRNGRSLNMDWTSTLSPRMTFNLRAGLTRWETTGGSSIGANYDPKQLGIDPALVAQFTRYQFPRFDMEGYVSLGSDSIGLQTNDTYTVQPNLNYVFGRHFLKIGGEGRRYNNNSPGRGYPSGYWSFGRNWTQANALRADAVSGNSLATMLLGIPSSGYVQKNIDSSYRHFYWAGFIQDDWKVTSRLTLNIGLRWDVETGKVERFDRQVLGLDVNAASPIAGQVQGLNLKGAVLFAGKDGQPRQAFSSDTNNWQPRVGVAYRIREKWVVRGGYGLSYLGQNENGTTAGFSRQTNAVVSTDGLTPYPGLRTANPYVSYTGSRLLDPIGSSQGAASFLGEGVTTLFRQRTIPYSHQYSFDIQRELPGNMLFEVGYSGNISRGLPLNLGVNYVPTNELGRRTAAGVIDSAYYTERVPNPMAGRIPNNAALNGTTIPRQNLWNAFPQYSGVTVSSLPLGKQRYDAVSFKVTKRLSQGLSFLGSYTVGKNLEQVSLLNAQDFVLSNWEDTRLVKQSADQIDTPQKFVVVGIYELPFGKGKPIGNGVSRLVDQFIGGWQVNFDVSFMSGWAIAYPNAAQVRPGSANLPSGERDRSRWFDTSLWKTSTGTPIPAQEPFTLRNFPLRFSDVRLPGYINQDLSLSKYFPITEQVRLQFRFEMVNAANHPWFTGMSGGGTNVGAGDFGFLNPAQGNLPRFIKLAMHLNF